MNQQAEAVAPGGRGVFGLTPVDENSAIARLLLAFLGTAGLFYVNIMPALVSGLIDGLGFSNREAGLVGSANMYGAAMGALCAVFLVKKVPWRATCVCLFFGLITLDGRSIRVLDFRRLEQMAKQSRE